jgi:hypothetical protein
MPSHRLGLVKRFELRAHRRRIERILKEIILMDIRLRYRSAKVKDIFERNVKEYKKLMNYKARFIDNMHRMESPSDIPGAIEYELMRVSRWQDLYEAWFAAYGYSKPEANSKTEWNEGLKAAALHCLDMRKKSPHVSQIGICREFLRSHTLPGHEDYTAEKLSNLASRMRT